jgi:hypothetical protein
VGSPSRKLARRASIAGSLAAVAIALSSPAASADPPAESALSSYSPYERETVHIALAQKGATLDTAPEGKIIEGIDVVTLEVFEPRDPIPHQLNGLVNWFHVTTKPHFIERELLFKRGEVYSKALVDESARNLRALPQLTVVMIVTTKGSAPGRVRVLVITKDLWSLRVPLEYRLTSSGALETLDAQITEINLLGTHHQLSANFTFDPNVISFGGSLVVPRVWDSRFRFVADVNPIYNYKTGVLEGSFGSFSYQKPLFSLATEWAYGASIAWNTGVSRRYIASDVSLYDANADLCVQPKKLSPGGGGIPCQYSRDRQSGNIFVTRSFGTEIKHNFTLSAQALRNVYRPPDLSAYDPAVAAKFKDRVPPVSDTRLGPALQYQTYAATYARVLDFERLGLQEEFQLGHNLILKAAPAYAPLRDSRFVVNVFAAASYTAPFGDGLARAYVESITDFEPSSVPDASIDVGGRVVTPRTLLGRLVFDARLLHRYRNSLNDISALGGDTRLRGYPSSLFRGKDLVAFNAEYRSRPIEVLKAQIGGVLFFDSGAAFDGFSNLRLGSDPKQPNDPRLQATGGLSAGFGLRVFLPQINRIVIRADWGFPLARGYRETDSFPGELTVTFGQAFPVPVVPTSSETTQ